MPPSAVRAEHRIELLEGSVELFPALIAAIDAALTEVCLETYLFDLTAGGLAHLRQCACALPHAGGGHERRVRGAVRDFDHGPACFIQPESVSAMSVGALC